MADTSVATNVHSEFEAVGSFGPYYSDTLKGAIIFIDAQSDLSVAYTDDGGATWAISELDSPVCEGVSVWWDKETPGDTGTTLHIAYVESTGGDSFKYISYNVDTGTPGTIREIDTSVTVDALFTLNRVGITKTPNDTLIAALSTQTELVTYKSSDFFATSGTSIASPLETATEEDWFFLFPADTGDDSDAAALVWDRSESELSTKVYDDSADSWGETTISGSMTAHAFYPQWDASVRHSDKAILLTAHSAYNTAGDDLRTFEVIVDAVGAGNATVTEKGTIFTDQDDAGFAGMLVNQQNNNVFVSYIRGSAMGSSVDVYYLMSDDDMATWTGITETQYNENTAADFKTVHLGRTVGNDGGRVQPCFFYDGVTELFVNLNNDIEIAAAGVGNPWYAFAQQ